MIAPTVAALALSLLAQDTSRLALSDAVQRALTQFPSAGLARAARDRANADVREARSAALPRLSLDATATRYQLPMLVLPLHGFPSPVAPPPGGNPAFDQTLYQGSAFATWTFFDFGARSGRTRASRALAGAADAAVIAAEQALIARTANAWLRALSARQVLEAQDRRIAALSAETDRTRRLLAEGKAARVELLRAEAALARTRADRSGTAGRLDVAERELAQLTAQPWERIGAGTLPPVELRDTSLAVTQNRATLLARAETSNPELLEARRRRDAARAAAGAVRATRLPELRASAGVVERGAASTALHGEWQAGVGVSYPLYSGGQRGGQIARAEADARGATDQLRLAEANVALSVDRAVAAVVEAHARVVALEVAVRQSDAVAEIERTALEVGSGTQNDYLDALAVALLTSSQLIESRHAEISARIELARVTGELSPEWIATQLESAR